MTREFRMPSNWAILRARIASSMRWRSTGCKAENMKKSQKRSVKDIIVSFASPASHRGESQNPLVGIVGSVAALRLRQQRAKGETGKKPTDMRPPCNPAGTGRHQQVDGSAQNLRQKPQSNKNNCRNLEKERQEQDRDQNDDACQREQAQVAAEHAGDRTRGAERGLHRCRIE